jgi:hypothetical protein
MSVGKPRAVEPREAKYLMAIQAVTFGVYEVSFRSKDGRQLTSIARVRPSDDIVDSDPAVVSFDSEDVGKQIMLGLIQIQPICKAVMAFHRAQRNS